MILNALAGKPLPVYGDGSQIRDWLYVEDHARALWTVLTRGNRGDLQHRWPQRAAEPGVVRRSAATLEAMRTQAAGGAMRS